MLPYVFKLFDAQGVLVYERKGETDIPNTIKLALFESSLITGERKPQRAFFEFSKTPQWRRAEDATLDVSVRDTRLTKEETEPRLTARLCKQ